MAKKKRPARARSATADEPLRRDRRDASPPPQKPDVGEELVRAVRRVARESEILPGVPLS